MLFITQLLNYFKNSVQIYEHFQIILKIVYEILDSTIENYKKFRIIGKYIIRKDFKVCLKAFIRRFSV